MIINESEKLELIYIPLSDAVLWDENPKTHHVQMIWQSIQNRGFQDPGKFDRTLGGMIFGNGRTRVLQMMKDNGADRPKGIGEDEEGNWYVPVIYGNDFDNKEDAVAFALDHNMITSMGGDGVTHLDASRMYDQKKYLALMEDVVSKAKSVVADRDDIELMKEVLRRQKEEPLVLEEEEKDTHKQETYSVSISFDTLEDKQEFIELLKQHAEEEAISNRGELLLHILS